MVAVEGQGNVRFSFKLKAKAIEVADGLEGSSKERVKIGGQRGR